MVFFMKQTILNLKKEVKPYELEGQAGVAIGDIITLIVGIGVSVLILIFIGVLGGQTYNLVEEDLDAITNSTIRNSVKNGIISSFSALETTGDFLPIIVLAVIIAIVLSLVLGFTQLGGGSLGGGRTAL